MGNIAKPIVEGSTMQQILPFKLSQTTGEAAQQQQQLTGTVSTSALSSLNSSTKRSPKSSSSVSGYHRLPPPPPPPRDSPPSSSGMEPVSHQRTGSSPAQMPQVAGPRVVNTLPKSSSMSAKDGDRSKHQTGEGEGEDKVIYF